MGRRFIEPPPFDLPGSYKESSAVTPLLFILSTGSDPTSVGRRKLKRSTTVPAKFHNRSKTVPKPFHNRSTTVPQTFDDPFHNRWSNPTPRRCSSSRTTWAR